MDMEKRGLFRGFLARLEAAMPEYRNAIRRVGAIFEAEASNAEMREKMGKAGFAVSNDGKAKDAARDIIKELDKAILSLDGTDVKNSLLPFYDDVRKQASIFADAKANSDTDIKNFGRFLVWARDAMFGFPKAPKDLREKYEVNRENGAIGQIEKALGGFFQAMSRFIGIVKALPKEAKPVSKEDKPAAEAPETPEETAAVSAAQGHPLIPAEALEKFTELAKDIKAEDKTGGVIAFRGSDEVAEKFIGTLDERMQSELGESLFEKKTLRPDLDDWDDAHVIGLTAIDEGTSIGKLRKVFQFADEIAANIFGKYKWAKFAMFTNINKEVSKKESRAISQVDAGKYAISTDMLGRIVDPNGSLVTKYAREDKSMEPREIPGYVNKILRSVAEKVNNMTAEELKALTTDSMKELAGRTWSPSLDNYILTKLAAELSAYGNNIIVAAEGEGERQVSRLWGNAARNGILGNRESLLSRLG